MTEWLRCQIKNHARISLEQYLDEDPTFRGTLLAQVQAEAVTIVYPRQNYVIISYHLVVNAICNTTGVAAIWVVLGGLKTWHDLGTLCKDFIGKKHS